MEILADTKKDRTFSATWSQTPKFRDTRDLEVITASALVVASFLEPLEKSSQ